MVRWHFLLWQKLFDVRYPDIRSYVKSSFSLCYLDIASLWHWLLGICYLGESGNALRHSLLRQELPEHMLSMPFGPLTPTTQTFPTFVQCDFCVFVLGYPDICSFYWCCQSQSRYTYRNKIIFNPEYVSGIISDSTYILTCRLSWKLKESVVIPLLMHSLFGGYGYGGESKAIVTVVAYVLVLSGPDVLYSEEPWGIGDYRL